MIIQALLTVNPYSRPGRKRDQVQALIMHWTGKPMQGGRGVRDYYEALKLQKAPEDPETAKRWEPVYASIHYVVDLDGAVYRCIPEDEMAYHIGSAQVDPESGRIYTDWARTKFGEHALHPENLSPNHCAIGIEMCTLNAEGDFTRTTLETAAALAADICQRLALNPAQDIATHHMVVGWKDCPRLWTNQPELLEVFRQDVIRRLS